VTDEAKVENIHRFQDETDRARMFATLVHLRISQGITQADVASRMGTSQANVSELEQGWQEGRDSSISTIKRYARAIGIELRMWIEPKDPELVEPPAGKAGGSGEEGTG
jgi:transcriptional regulator with XRE-family HTH domain